VLRYVTIEFAAPPVLLAGCGNSRTPVPSISAPAPPAMFNAVDHAVFSSLKNSLRLLPATRP
jgi:hypothetical protein